MLNYTTKYRAKNNPKSHRTPSHHTPNTPTPNCQILINPCTLSLSRFKWEHYLKNINMILKIINVHLISVRQFIEKYTLRLTHLSRYALPKFPPRRRHRLCSSNIRVMIWTMKSTKATLFFFFYTRNLYDTVLRGSCFNFSLLVGRKFQLWSITSTYLFLCFLFYAIILFLYYNPSSPFL